MRTSGELPLCRNRERAGCRGSEINSSEYEVGLWSNRIEQLGGFGVPCSNLGGDDKEAVGGREW